MTREEAKQNTWRAHCNFDDPRKAIHIVIDQIFDYKSNPKTWVYKGDLPAIIDFYAEWCQPCKRVAPIMDELAKDYSGKINIFKIILYLFVLWLFFKLSNTITNMRDPLMKLLT